MGTLAAALPRRVTHKCRAQVWGHGLTGEWPPATAVQGRCRLFAGCRGRTRPPCRRVETVVGLRAGGDGPDVCRVEASEAAGLEERGVDLVAGVHGEARQLGDTLRLDLAQGGVSVTTSMASLVVPMMTPLPVPRPAAVLFMKLAGRRRSCASQSSASTSISVVSGSDAAVGRTHEEGRKQRKKNSGGHNLATQIDGQQIEGCEKKFGNPTKIKAHLEGLLEIKFLYPLCKYRYGSLFSHPAGDALTTEAS